jgi:hypothetical protein
MKGYVERFGRCLRVSYDPVTKAFVEVTVDQLRFLPGSLTAKSEEKPAADVASVLRYAAE